MGDRSRFFDMHIVADASKAIERYGSEAPFVLCELIATSILIDEAELADDFAQILIEIEQQLRVISIWQ